MANAKHDLILSHGWSSSASRKVRFALGEKGLAYESRPVNVRKNEHHTPEYRSIQPDGVVPAMIFDGVTLIESTLIIEFLDDMFPEPRLRPEDALAAHRMRLWCKQVDDRYLPAVLRHNWQLSIHPIAREWSDEELEKKLANIPNPERRNFWYRMARDPFTPAELEEAMETLRGLVREMEPALQERDFLCADHITLADIAVTPYIRRINELEPDLIGDAYPRTRDWWARIEARPGFKAAHILAFVDQSNVDYPGPSA